MKKLFLFIALYVCALQEIKAQDLVVSLSKTDKECEPGKASITVTSGTVPYQYAWSNASVMDYVENLEAGSYTVTVTDARAHDTTIVFTIEESICEPVPEKYFSPNGDSVHDSWRISRLNYFPDFDLYVYNRWGQQVHHQSNQYIPWDGTHLGLPLPDATYYYILFLSKTDKNKILKGDVSIIR
jgi:gliding motility-associated-like protein